MTLPRHALLSGDRPHALPLGADTSVLCVESAAVLRPSATHSFIKNDDAIESLPPLQQELLAAENTDVKARFRKVTSSVQTTRQWGGLHPGPFSPLCLHSAPGESDIHPAAAAQATAPPRR